MALVQGDTPPGSQYGMTGADWLQSLGAGLAGLSRGPGRGSLAALEMLQSIQRQQDRANKTAGYAAFKPSQALMDWVKKWIVAQEKDKMDILNEAPEVEAP